MRQALRGLFVLICALLGVVAVAVAGTITSFVALAATALIVPGTGTPNANVLPGYMQNAVSRYLTQTRCFVNGVANGCDVAVPDPSANLIGINYPASFWPMPFPGWCEPGTCKKWNVSVGQGVSALNAEVIEQWTANPNEDIVIFGYSQGGAVVSNELRNLDQLPPEIKDQLQVVMIGNIANPDGGLWQRLRPISILGELLLDATFGPPMITDSGIPITNIGFEYDPVVYAPRYWGNPLAMLNAIAAFDNVHGYYLAGPNRPGTGTMPYGYTDAELAAAIADPNNIRYGGHDPNSPNKYIMIPAKSLPLANLILSLAESTGTTPVVKPLVDLLSPAAKVLIDLGYDWSGDPDVPKSLSLLPFNPFNNWVEVGVDLVEALGEGVHNVVGGPGAAATTGPPAAPVEGLSVLADPAPAPKPLSERVRALAAAEQESPEVVAVGAAADGALETPAAEPAEGIDTEPAKKPAELSAKKLRKDLRGAVKTFFDKGAKKNGLAKGLKNGRGDKDVEQKQDEGATAAEDDTEKAPAGGDDGNDRNAGNDAKQAA